MGLGGFVEEYRVWRDRGGGRGYEDMWELLGLLREAGYL